MKKTTILRNIKSILFGLCLAALPCLPQTAEASTTYTWAHQVQETYVVTPGYYETQTYQSGWTTEQQQYVVQDGYWTTEQYVSGYTSQTQTVLVSAGHYETQSYLEQAGYYSTETYQSGTTTQQQLVSGAYDSTEKTWVSSGYEAHSGYYTYPNGHWIYTSVNGDLCYRPCGGGRFWSSGAGVWHDTSHWVDTSHYVTTTVHHPAVYQTVTVPVYSTRQVWHDPVYGYQQVWVNPVYSTQTVQVPIYSTRQVWVDPVYGTRSVQVPVYSTRQVWHDPVYGTQTVTVYTPIQPPVVNSASITPNPALDTDTLKANVSSSDPSGYTVGAEQWTVTGPNGTTTSSSAPTHLMPGNYQISVAVQNEAPDGTPASWSDPYTMNVTVNPAVVAQIGDVTLTGVVHPPGYIPLPQSMPAGSPVSVESGYNITMHVSSQGAGQLTTALYAGGVQVSSNTTSVPDGGSDVTFYIPTSVANKSVVDVKFTLRCTDPAGYSTTAVKMVSGAFVVNGSSAGDTLVNQTH